MESQNADMISSNPIHQHDGEVKKHVMADLQQEIYEENGEAVLSPISTKSKKYVLC